VPGQFFSDQELEGYCAVHICEVSATASIQEVQMNEQFKAGEEFQRMGQDGFNAVMRAYGEANKGFQAIVVEAIDYSKRAFEDATLAWEQVIGARSVEQAIEVQSRYAKKAYDAHIAQVSKFGEMYVATARNVYKPAEQTAARVQQATARKVA
jgi:hypothetical protein